MEKVFKAAWDFMKTSCVIRKDLLLIDTEENKKQFLDDCVTMYKEFVKKYMKKPEGKKEINLDRHKIAAIISIAGSNNEYFESKKLIDSENVFLGEHSVPILAGLALIEQETADDIKRFKLKKENKDFCLYIPAPSSCDTFYIDSLARMIHYEAEFRKAYQPQEQDKSLENDLIKILEWANTFFLIEECSLITYGIDMPTWVELKKADNAKKR